MLKTLSKLNTCVYYWNSVENTPNNYGKRFPPLLRVFPATPTVVNNSVGNGFYDAFPGNSSTQNELKSKKNQLPKNHVKFVKFLPVSKNNLTLINNIAKNRQKSQFSFHI